MAENVASGLIGETNIAYDLSKLIIQKCLINCIFRSNKSYSIINNLNIINSNFNNDKTYFVKSEYVTNNAIFEILSKDINEKFLLEIFDIDNIWKFDSVTQKLILR